MGKGGGTNEFSGVTKELNEQTEEKAKEIALPN